MKLADVKKLTKGTKLFVSLGNGWYEVMSYNTTHETWSMGKMTLSDLMKSDFEWTPVRKETLVEMVDEKGKTHHYNARRLSMIEK